MSIDPADRAIVDQLGAQLCAGCVHVRLVRSGRGSSFVMCERGLRREPGFPKYPRLPLLRCGGHEPAPLERIGY